MKRIFLLLCFVMLSVVNASAQFEPEWITQKPLSYNEYIGVASAPLSDPDHRQTARLLALNEIAAQISINIESSSVLNTTDMNGSVREEFELNIAQSLSAELSGQELVDSYQTSDRYYVYYKLDKDVYGRIVAQKVSVAVDRALALLTTGAVLEANGELVAALSSYSEGLNVVEPYLNYSLECEYKGNTVNIANELYSTFKEVLNGMALSSNKAKFNVQSLCATKEPVEVCLSKEGRVVPNMLLSAEFTTGAGDVTSQSKTSYNGLATFYVTNVTAKDAIQTLRVTLDDGFLEELPSAYRALVLRSNWPEATIILNVESAVRTAYFAVGRNDITACESQVRSIFANNYFEVTDNPDADLYIEYSTAFSKGKEVDGEIYKLRECFASLSVKIYNNKTRSLLGEYTLPERRVLVAADRSNAQMMQSCARELIKQFKAGLPRVLKGITL